MKEASRSAHLEVTLTAAHGEAVSSLVPLVNGRILVSDDGRRLSAAVDSTPGFATSVVRALDAAGVLVDNIAVRQPSLDDVFFSLTGGHIEEDGGETGEGASADAEPGRSELEGVSS